MRSYVILLFIVSCCQISFGQIDLVAKFKAHKFPCDSGVTSLEANICSGVKRDYADSLLNHLYNKIIRSLDKEIREAKKEISAEQSKKDSGTESKENIKFLLKEIERNQRLRISIIKSQKEWIKVRDYNAEVIRISCEGATSCTSMENQSLLDDTLERIKILESFYEFP
jgi:uncharacterized protein YecT (DUF1311 family)